MKRSGNTGVGSSSVRNNRRRALFVRISRVKDSGRLPGAGTQVVGHEALTSNANEERLRRFESAYERE